MPMDMQGLDWKGEMVSPIVFCLLEIEWINGRVCKFSNCLLADGGNINLHSHQWVLQLE